MGMKRILGMMLASRMTGRGTRGSLGKSGLGGLAASGLLGGKTGLAALGYMAYRAYQDHSARAGGSEPQAAAGSGTAHSAASGRASTDGGLGSAIRDIAKTVSDALSPQAGAEKDGAPAAGPERPDAAAGPAFSPEEERAAETFSENTALLLVRAMVTAANADGTITGDERARILAQAEESGADATERGALEHELANPRPLDELLEQVRDEETAEEFYFASLMAVDETLMKNRAYLVLLRERLGLEEKQTAQIEDVAT